MQNANPKRFGLPQLFSRVIKAGNQIRIWRSIQAKPIVYESFWEATNGIFKILRKIFKSAHRA